MCAEYILFCIDWQGVKNLITILNLFDGISVGEIF